jgi:2-C-methyl-D-erythritol 4-phosphate cytidylyltransferase
VAIVPAPRENLKVTTPLDLQLAELLLARRGER